VTPAAISLLLVHLKKRRLGAFALHPPQAADSTENSRGNNTGHGADDAAALGSTDQDNSNMPLSNAA
jgi:hypothetical protein